MTTTPTVSIVIPTFRHRDYIRHTLETVFSQTFLDYEVIVVNDGSPDNTAEVLEPFVRDGRIRYFEQENSGQAAARNRGLREARGDLVAFLDDDDLWPSDKLEWQVEELCKHPKAGGVGGTHLSVGPLPCVTYEAGRKELSVAELYAFAGFISPGAVLFRTSTIRALGGFNQNLWGADDYDMYIRVARISPMIFVDRAALWYRVHDGNASKQAARLLVNVANCLNAHFTHERFWEVSAQRRRGANFLYGCLGRNVMCGAVSGSLCQKIGEIEKVAQSLWPWFLCNPRTGVWFIREAFVLLRGGHLDASSSLGSVESSYIKAKTWSHIAKPES